MVMKTKHIVIGAVVLVLVLLGLFFFRTAGPGPHDELAQCISDRGAVFYGAFWCSHCNDQKALFGASVKKLPYVECSTPNRQGQTQECQDEGISAYPTWEFPDGSREVGVFDLEELARRTGCELSE